uniref:Methyltransferase FkbM domain-containing protein n=1 Tax=viral metagenome TaxID=1070528 RepID=A0A6C0LBY6_9ZZZZ
MKILYGLFENNIDVSEICYNQLMKNSIITIPSRDNSRAAYFSDPIFGTLKKIIIIDNEGNTREYDDTLCVQINTITNEITVTDVENFINNKINHLHSTLKINYGHFYEELPEQKMAVKYLTGNEKVLEIGGNIGRNSLIISSILCSNNFVTLESDINIANQLLENRNINNMNFHIESSALSKRKLIQRGWDTIASDTLLDGYSPVNTITYDELVSKYNINFDTLVLDCEGAFYYILMDMPEILNNINLIIMENDYWDIEKKNFIDNILKSNNFYVEYSESGGWGPCYNNFFEVWKKR